MGPEFTSLGPGFTSLGPGFTSLGPGFTSLGPGFTRLIHCVPLDHSLDYSPSHDTKCIL